jgi:hypothetical protein
MSRNYAPDDVSPKQTALATELRVPFITSPHPRWFYVTAIVVSDDLWRGLEPTEDEVRAVASFNDHYRDHWYRDSYKAKMRAFAPYDIDGGAVGRYLIKHANGGWGYRKHTWQYGPEFVPQWDAESESLIAVLDRCESIVADEPMPRWTRWKADHADVFARIAPVTPRTT